jgi:hypothetical protein
MKRLVTLMLKGMPSHQFEVAKRERHFEQAIYAIILFCRSGRSRVGRSGRRTASADGRREVTASAYPYPPLEEDIMAAVTANPSVLYSQEGQPAAFHGAKRRRTVLPA